MVEDQVNYEIFRLRAKIMGEDKSRFKELMRSEGCTFYDDEMKPEKSGTLKNKFDVIVHAMFTDILEKKSQTFRTMVAQGMEFDFAKSVKMPDEPIKSKYQNLYEEYMGDMK